MVKKSLISGTNYLNVKHCSRNWETKATTTVQTVHKFLKNFQIQNQGSINSSNQQQTLVFSSFSHSLYIFKNGSRQDLHLRCQEVQVRH